jgi:hypothetical protein
MPDGERNGRILPLTADLIDVVGLRPILEAAGVPASQGDFENIYSGIATSGGSRALLGELERRVDAYFAQMRLPDQPTLYDHLLLSLRAKDFVATFNWDPLLWQAFARCRRIASMPRVVALHGSVALGYCDCGKPVLFGERAWKCQRCGSALKSVPLLYPIAEKDYVSNPLIAAAWHDLTMVLQHALALTIFGYGGARTDAAALELMQEGWGDPEKRKLEELEVIDLKPKAELLETWRPFIHTHHWGVYSSFYESYMLARWPRRTCEGLWNAVMQNDPDPDNFLPADAGWAELESFIAPLAEAERAADSGR